MTARIVLDVQAAAPGAALRRLAQFGSGPLQLALADIGEEWLLIHQLRFDRQAAPDGTPWAPLSPRYKAVKDKQRPGKPLLVFDNFLKGQLRYQVAGDELQFGSDRPYAALHHFGGTASMKGGAAKVPRRPWLGLAAQDDEETLAILERHLVKELGSPGT